VRHQAEYLCGQVERSWMTCDEITALPGSGNVYIG
jgi:hypothetical protein